MASVLKALKNNDPRYDPFFLNISYPYFLLHTGRADILKPYLSAARWIPLAINPYANLTTVFFTALEEEGIQDEELEQCSEM